MHNNSSIICNHIEIQYQKQIIDPIKVTSFYYTNFHGRVHIIAILLTINQVTPIEQPPFYFTIQKFYYLLPINSDTTTFIPCKKEFGKEITFHNHIQLQP